MVGGQEDYVSVKELVFYKGASEEEDSDGINELHGLNMERSASTGADGATLTVSIRQRGVVGQANEEELGKKLLVVPSSHHQPSPHRNYSEQESSQQDDKKQQQQQQGGLERFSRQQQAQQRALYPSVANSAFANSSTSPVIPMETNYGLVKKTTPAQPVRCVDMEMNTETDDQLYHCAKEITRYRSENLDSSLDYGRRDSLPGTSRHICKHCAKEFTSGRALGGHMRAHGSLVVEDAAAHAWTSTNSTDPLEKQLSGSMGGHGTHLVINNNNPDSGSDHALSNIVQPGGGHSPYSKRSRSSGMEILSGRSGGRRSKKAAKHQREMTGKNSEDDIIEKTIQQEEKQNAATEEDAEEDEEEAEEEEAGDPMTEPEPSMSLDDDGNNEGGNDDGIVTDQGAANNVCNVCDREFENGKQLNSHKKSHGLYALRRNPKRSRRFIDQDYPAEAAAATVPAKKSSSMFTPDGNMHACTECGKRFQSWKALFGHMRCHPERNWRGIHRPVVVKDKQEASSSADQRQQQLQHQHLQQQQQLTVSRRKEASAGAAAPNAKSVESDSVSEAVADARDETELFGQGKAAAVSDNESDTESIEAAYMNGGERQPSTSTGWIWITGKRSKRSRQTVRPLHTVTKTGTSAARPAAAPADNDIVEHETAMGLMMLARKEGGKQSWRESSELALLPRRIQENASSDTEGDEGHLNDRNAADSSDDLELALVHNHKGKGKLDAADNTSLCDENEEAGDDCEIGEQGANSTKPKYICNTCKRVFKSHQALGGHRASHKKVKGCFARTNVSENEPENLDEDMISEEYPRSEDLPTELQEPSQSEGEVDEKERQLSTYSKDDSEEVVNGSRMKTKGHVCTICGRVFNSGQALGGHKRCHYNTKEGTSSEATSSTNNTMKQSAVAAQLQSGGGHGKIYRDDPVHQGYPARIEETMKMKLGRSGSEEFTQPAAPVRLMKEKFLDLNLPAPVNDDDMELEAYDRPPANLICAMQPKAMDFKGALSFPSAMGIIKSSNFDAELERGKAKEEYFPLYHTGKYASQLEENEQDLGGGQDTGFRGGEVDFSLRYVRCKNCDRSFSTAEALINHETVCLYDVSNLRAGSYISSEDGPSSEQSRQMSPMMALSLGIYVTAHTERLSFIPAL